MNRYLMFISYIGTEFRGLQKQSLKQAHLRTVVGTLQKALEELDPANPVVITTSSRTDKGVHALSNAVTVDLQHRDEGTNFDPDDITTTVNQQMMACDLGLRINKTIPVSQGFRCRYALYRKYVYRVAVSHEERRHMIKPFLPMEYYRMLDFKQPLDIDKVHEAAALLGGTHDFTSFTVRRQLEKNPRNPVRPMDVEIQKGHCFLHEHAQFFTDQYNVWNFVFKSNGFLYKQVRKMVAVLLGVGAGNVTLDNVREMLDNPGAPDHYRYSSTVYVPSYGLYLANVQYKEEDYYKEPPPPDSEDKTEECAAETETSNDRDIDSIKDIHINERINESEDRTDIYKCATDSKMNSDRDINSPNGSTDTLS